MKHIRILIASIALLIAAAMTAGAPNRIFSNIPKTEGLTSVYISPAAMKLGLSMTDTFISGNKIDGIGAAISNPRGMEVLTTEIPRIAAMLQKEVEATVEKLGMVLFLNANENNSEDVNIYVGNQSADGTTISDILIVAADGNEFSVVYIGGDIAADVILQ